METRDVSNEFINFTMKLKKYIKTSINDANNKQVFTLTQAQFGVLLQLGCLKKCTLKDLSKKIKVSNSSLCIMLNKMSEEGLVKRETDPKDRRNTFYSLTDKGNKLLNDEQERILSYLDSRIKNLSEDRKIKLFECLKDMSEIIEELK